MKIRTALIAAALATGALAAAGTPATAAPAAAPGGIGTYRVTFYTGDLDGAGTDATILLQAHGNQGSSTVENLDNDEDNFERAKTDRFGAFKWLNVGDVSAVTVTKRSNGSAWFPGYVQVYNEADGRVVTCWMGEWYSGGNTTRTYNCS